MRWLRDRARWLVWTVQSWFLPREVRPGSDDQRRSWTGPNGRPVLLNDEAAADRFEERGHG